MAKLNELCGMLVSDAVKAEALRTMPERHPTYGDRYWAAMRANHVLLIAREHGEEPADAEPKFSAYGRGF